MDRRKSNQFKEEDEDKIRKIKQDELWRAMQRESLCESKGMKEISVSLRRRLL